MAQVGAKMPQLSEDGIRFKVVMQGKDIDNLFNLCYKEDADFCDDDASLTIRC